MNIKVKDTKVKDALDHIRESAQELHGAISDATAKRGGALKADIEAVNDNSGNATRSAPLVTARSTNRRCLARFASKAPAVGLSWAAANFMAASPSYPACPDSRITCAESPRSLRYLVAQSPRSRLPDIDLAPLRQAPI